MERRLAAIMATDVVGYSRLIRADEEGTLAALKALRNKLVDPTIAEHHGRIDDARELRQHAIAHQLDDPPMVLSNCWID